MRAGSCKGSHWLTELVNGCGTGVACSRLYNPDLKFPPRVSALNEGLFPTGPKSRPNEGRDSTMTTANKVTSNAVDVYLASPRGFCAGVVLAVDIVELALKKYGSPVYVKHQIVHNPIVVADTERKGAITVEHVTDVPEGAVVVFSAHGSPPSDYAEAQRRNLTVIDATCPLVTRVHNEAKKYSREGKKIILVGHRGHQEVIGSTGQTDMTLIDEREGINVPDFEHGAEVAVQVNIDRLRATRATHIELDDEVRRAC